jgi:hypothetical protein
MARVRLDSRSAWASLPFIALLTSGCGLNPAGILPTGGGDASIDAGHLRDAARTDGGMSADSTLSADVGTHDAQVDDARVAEDASRDSGKPGDSGRDTSTVCAADCPNGDACTEATQCASGLCKAHVCATPVDCNELHTGGVTASGPYAIRPAGSNGSFQAYCDMTDQGGGWTLVLKMGTVGSPGTFDYASAYWTNSTLLNAMSTDMSQTEAKLDSYLAVPFTNILVMMEALDASAPTQLVVPIPDSTSLSHLITMSATNTVTTTLGARAWTGLTVPAATIQPNCNVEGINIVPGSGGCTGATGTSVRIGIIANDQTDCCSPNSYVGFGGDDEGDGDCYPVLYSAGSMVGIGCTGGGTNIQNFGFIFVR